MFPDGKWPNHWVDSYVHMIRKKCLCGEGWKGRRRIRIQRIFMNTVGRERINERRGIMMLNNEKEG